MAIKFEIGPKALGLPHPENLELYTAFFHQGGQIWSEQEKNPGVLKYSATTTSLLSGQYNYYMLVLTSKFSGKSLAEVIVKNIFRKGQGGLVEPVGNFTRTGRLQKKEKFFVGENGKLVHDESEAYMVLTGT